MASPYRAPLSKPRPSPLPLQSIFLWQQRVPLSWLLPPLCVLSGPILSPLQVLCSVLLPADAGHGGRLRWKGGSSEDTEGHPDDDPHRPLLLLLPLLPQTHAHQVREEGEASSKNRLPLPALSQEHLLALSALPQASWN